MAKTNGLGAAITLADADTDVQTITNDVNEFTIETPVAMQDVTGVDKYAHERLALLADASASLKGTFNAAANLSHAVLSSVASTPVVRALKITPSSSTDPYLGMNVWVTDYQVARSNSGELTWTAPLVLADGAVPTWTNS